MSAKPPRDAVSKPAPGAAGDRGASADDAPVAVVGRVAAEGAIGAVNHFLTLLLLLPLAFAGLMLMLGWQFGPLVMQRAHDYRQMTGRVDATIVDSWLALEFDGATMRVPENWRAATAAARCEVVEYGGDWGPPLRRAFCGTRVPFNDSYLLADLGDISPGVAFAWPRDEHGFVVPQIRMAAATRDWLAAHTPRRFMHDAWPAKNSLDWLRLEHDQPLDAAIHGWTAPAPLLPLAYDPARPDGALPAAIVARRQQQSPNWVVVVVGFGLGLAVWFRTMAMLPLLSGLAPFARRIIAALPLLSLPWWMDAFPAAIGHFSRDAGEIVESMFADVAPTDRLVATAPGEAMLVGGERIVWRLPDSVYADTFGTFRYAPPAQPYATTDAAFAAIAATIATQVRAQDDGRRAELFARLLRNRHDDLTAVDPAFVPAAKEAAADPAAGEATRAAARRFLQ